MKSIVPTVLALIACSALPSSAALIVSYNFDDSGSPTTPAVMEAGTTSTAIVPHGSIGVPARPVIYPGWAAAPTSEVVGSGTTAGDENAAVLGSDYHSFTITPTTGNALNLTNISFSTAFYTASGAAVTLSGNYFVRSSIDNFAVTLGSVFNESHVINANPEFNQREIELSGPAFENISVPVTFRIYLFDNSTGTTRYLAIDNVNVFGEVVAIPEVSSLALLLAGGTLLSRRRRERP